MIDDYAVKKLREMMRMLDSPGMREMIRAVEDHKRALGGVDNAVLRDAIEKASYLKDISRSYGATMQISKAMLDLGCASRIYSDSIFGTEAIRQIASASDALADSVKAAKSGVLEIGRIQADQMARLAESIKRPEWLTQIRDLSATVKGFELASFESRFRSFSRIVEQAELSMRLVQWENIASLQIAPPIWNSLEFRTEQLNRSFAAFAERMAFEPKSVVTAPPFVSNLPPLAVYTHAEALRLISVEAESEEEQEEEQQPEKDVWGNVRDQTFAVIEDLLPRVSPELITSWRGGWRTAHKKSPDWVRQAAASFRYVLITVLDTVAPHELVRAEANPKLLENGKVVRKTQVAWLCEPIKNKTHRKVFYANIESAISMIDAFSEAVHRAQDRNLAASFESVAVRTAIALQHILELYFGNGRKKP